MICHGFPQRNTSMRSPDQTQLNTTCIMAKAAACTSEGCPSSCTWVNNFNGFSVSDLNPMFAIKAAKANHTRAPAFPSSPRLALQLTHSVPSFLLSLRFTSHASGFQRPVPRAPAPQDHSRPPLHLLGASEGSKAVHSTGAYQAGPSWLRGMSTDFWL